MAVRPFDEIFRDFVVNGLPASGLHHPHKADIRDSLNALIAGPFPDNRVIKLNNVNTGTGDNIVVTASVEIPAAAFQVLYILNVTQENTGPVKVSGAINRDLVTNTNHPLPAGYLTPAMALLCSIQVRNCACCPTGMRKPSRKLPKMPLHVRKMPRQLPRAPLARTCRMPRAAQL